jgi:HEAT repeat protein
VNAQAQEIFLGLSRLRPGSKAWRQQMQMLQRAAPELALDLLRTSLASSDAHVRAAAQQLLVEAATPGATAVLTASLAHASSLDVTTVTRLLTNIDARSSVPALVACLSEREELSRMARERLAYALGKMPNRQTVPALEQLLDDRAPSTRRIAAKALSRIRAPESTAALQRASERLSWLGGISVRRALRARIRDGD